MEAKMELERKLAGAVQEPSLVDLLAATIVQAMMGADGVSAEDVRAVMRAGSKHGLDGLLENKVGVRNRPDSVASFLSLETALNFCRQLSSEGRRVTEVVGPWGETLGASIAKLLVP
jgi:hypothetical protein